MEGINWAIKQCKVLHFPENSRSLMQSEIDDLKRNGNVVIPETTKQKQLNKENDWSNIRVIINRTSTSNSKERLHTSRIRNNRFIGNVFIASSFQKPNITFRSNGGKTINLPRGIYGSTLADNTIVFQETCIMDATLIAQTIIGPEALILRPGTITGRAQSNKAAFAQNLIISVCPETGGRDIHCYPTMTVQDAALQAQPLQEEEEEAFERNNLPGNRKKSEVHQVSMVKSDLSKHFRNAVGSLDHSVISEGCRIVAINSICSSFIGPQSVISTGAEVHDSFILARTTVDSNSIVRHSMLQDNVTVSGGSIVNNSFMHKHSHIDIHGKLRESILGSFSGVEEGEVGSSLVGPLVGFHHQSLLIASYWPAGRGNIGYGANVGSNHTGKRNDQELWPGEGCFFGLGTSIKFPSNFSKAVYSLFATGVVTLPQTISFPFSLINTPGKSYPNLSPAFNEITPGWVLSDCAYLILRNEIKFAKRSLQKDPKSGEMRPAYVAKVIRLSNVLLMYEGRKKLMEMPTNQIVATAAAHHPTSKGSALTSNGTEELSSGKISSKGHLWIDANLKSKCRGLGKNYMSEKNRLKGIETYTYFIRLWSLRVLLEGIEKGLVLGGFVESIEDRTIFRTNKCWEEDIPFKEQLAYAVAILRREEKSKLRPHNRKTKYVTYQDLLVELVKMEEMFYQKILKSKEKDDRRGRRMFFDYDTVHSKSLAGVDNVVTFAKKSWNDTALRVERLLKRYPQKSKL
eukprot:g3386.t1